MHWLVICCINNQQPHKSLAGPENPSAADYPAYIQQNPELMHDIGAEEQGGAQSTNQRIYSAYS